MKNIILSIFLLSLITGTSCQGQDTINYQERTLNFILNNLERNYSSRIYKFNNTSNARIFYRFSKLNNDTAMLSDKLNSWSENYHVYKDTLVSNDVDLKNVKRQKELIGIDESRICDLSKNNCHEKKKGDLTLIIGEEIRRGKSHYVFVFLYSEGHDFFSSVLLLKFDSKGEVKRVIRTEGII